jgi:hypothetical protein
VQELGDYKLDEVPYVGFSTQNNVNTDKSHFSQPISTPNFGEMQRTIHADYKKGVWACFSECNFPPVA